MVSNKQQIMADLTATIQKKWGARIIKLGNEVGSATSLRPMPTSFRKLDMLLNGGILRGEITELHGIETSGTATLALKIIAQAQLLEERAIYIDPTNAFSPKYASDLGVNLEDLLIIRPATTSEGIEIAADIISRYSTGLVVFGHSVTEKGIGTQNAMRRLVSGVRRSSTAFVVLNRSTLPTTSPFHLHAGTRLELQRVRWINRWSVVGGYLVRVTLVKQAGRDSNRGVTVRFDLP